MRRLVPALLAALAACNTPSAITAVTEIPFGAVSVDWNDAGAVRVAHAYSSGFRQSARTSEYLYVELTSLRPGTRCFTTQALTQPVDMVRLPRQHPPVMFVEKSVEASC